MEKLESNPPCQKLDFAINLTEAIAETLRASFLSSECRDESADQLTILQN